MGTSDEKVREAAKLVLDALKSPAPLRAWLKSDAFNEGWLLTPRDCRYCPTSLFLTWFLKKQGYESAKAIVIDDAIVLWVDGVKQLLTAPAWVWRFEKRLQNHPNCTSYRPIMPLTAVKELEFACSECGIRMKE
jgi:hypothetical protein